MKPHYKKATRIIKITSFFLSKLCAKKKSEYKDRMQKRDLNHSVFSRIVLKIFVIRHFHCTSHTQCSCCIWADLGTYVPVAMCDSCHDTCTACSFTRLHIVCKGYLGVHMPALKCKSCQNKHRLRVLFLDRAWRTSFGIRAHLGMDITCLLDVKAARINMDCTFSYHTVPGVPAIV